MSLERGFTLLELMLVVAIAGVLAALAITTYRNYVIRGELAQQLVDIDHIRSVLAIESQNGLRDLQAGARAGLAPPALAGLLGDRDFTGKEGLNALLVEADASTFPQQARPAYGLVYGVPANDGALRLQLLYRELENTRFPKMWLTGNSFLVLLTAGDAGDAASTAVPPATLPAPAPDPASPTTPTAPAPSACPPGWTQVGQGNCKPPGGNQGANTSQACPPPWQPIGESGMCRLPQ